jgi:DNA-binding XRE family transcriptional regulator
MTQSELAAEAGVAQQTVSLIERGHADDATLRTVNRVVASLGATLDLVLRWKGPELDRLADARHARIVTAVVVCLGADWQVLAEYSFNHYGDRGSVDVLAWQPAKRALLLVEVKSELDSLEAVLRSMDVKVRVVPPVIARERAWRAKWLGSILVLPDESSARRSVARMSPIFDVSLPSRTVAVRQWLRAPAGPLRGIWFLADTPTRRVVRNPGSTGRVCGPRTVSAHARGELLEGSKEGIEVPATVESADNTPTRRR